MSFGKITKRSWDDSYVIERDGMPYHVPNVDGFKKLWEEVDAYAKANPDKVTIEKPYEPTAEELAAQELAQAKSERSNAVENITVEVDGMIFQGDETSQLRIARAIIALADGERITWVLADDTIVKVTKEQLKKVLRKAGEKQTELWTKPYEA